MSTQPLESAKNPLTDGGALVGEMDGALTRFRPSSLAGALAIARES